MSENNSDIKVYTMKEVADMLRVSYIYLTQMVKDGKLQAVKIGRRKLITKQALDEFLENNKCN